jgi:hypothetical protein
MLAFHSKKGAVAMNARGVLLAMLLPVFAGCVSSTTLMSSTNLSAADARQGEDCRVLVGIGGVPDLTGAEAMRQGGITRLRNTEYRENTFYSVGNVCMVAHGD